tara:strand:+ start:577 stop:834 length:258 start_codon:yes stop_codon:yes gene_type:complete
MPLRRKQDHALDAIFRWFVKNGPAQAKDAIENARLLNGNLMKESRNGISQHQAVARMGWDKRFRRVSFNKIEWVWIWDVVRGEEE